MISLRSPKRRDTVPGFAWPNSGTATKVAVRAPFGPRPYSAHVATIGYDYDFHQGYDLPLNQGDNVYSPVAGCITRKHQTHFGWENTEQLTCWTEIDANNSVVFTQASTSLHVAGTRAGSQAFTDAGKFVTALERVDISTGDWEIRWRLTSNPTLIGGVIGVGLYDAANNERVAIEYDGATLTTVAVHAAGNMSVNGNTASSTPIWFRVTYTQSSDTINWQYTATDPITTSTTWSTLATKATVAFTREGFPIWQPLVYWRSTDTNAAVQSIDIDSVSWFDTNGIGRFGNWIQVQTATGKAVLAHFQYISAAVGSVVESGALLGLAGNTGFDATSGPIVNEHGHVEWTTDTTYFYTRANATNFLAPGLEPRTNVSNNVSAVLSSANDPDAVASHLLTITVTRADQDFDLNQVSLTGNTTTAAVNLNTRSGLNANVDIPKQGGVYIVPNSFDENSASQVILVYFNKSTVGSTFVSAFIKDTAGTTLWSQ